MEITQTFLEKLEKNQELMKTYVAQGAWGSNKWVYLPAILCMVFAFGYWALYELNMLLSIYTLLNTAALGLCILAIRMIQSKTKKSLAANIDKVPACIACKTYGNDSEEIYYCIYTMGAKRHDPEFIQSVATKIFNIDDEPDSNIRKKINNMFGEKMEALAGHDAKLLPVDFTFGEKVYQKFYHLKYLSASMKKMIANNNGMFIVIPFNDISVPMLEEKDYTNL